MWSWLRRVPRGCFLSAAGLWIWVGSIGWIAGQNTTSPLEPAPKEVRWAVGGCGGAYLLASPGDLVIDVYKRDLHRRNTITELRAILAGPDRQVLHEVRIPDDGQPIGSGPGPWQWARLSTQVPRKGIYVLNITVSNDRYGEEIAWGFQTNCPKYLIETARGHRDEPHQEPLLLLAPEQPGQVCFQPRLGEIALEITGLPKEVRSLEVRDAKDQLLATVRVDSSARAEHRFPAAKIREAVPWRIVFPQQQATVHLDGLTRWQPDDPAPNIACWTPEPKSWFSWLENRWLLTPYRRIVYGEPGQQGTLRFEVYNNAPEKRKIDLLVEFPGSEWPIRLNRSSVEVPPRRAVEVLVSYTVPPNGQSQECFLRASPQDDPEFSTYSTITVIPGQAPCKKALNMPLVLKPYEHENEQFGYLPAYPLESQMYFDGENHPWLVSGGRLATWEQAGWQWRQLSETVTRRVPDFPGRNFSSATSKVAFDRENHVYVLARVGSQTALLHSSDRGKTFTAYLLPPPADGAGQGSQTFDIEEFTGHNVLEGPPPILRYSLTARDPKYFWRYIHNLELVVAEKKEGQIRFHAPVLVSRQCIGLAAHSGIPSSVVSRADRVHLVWGEATDPAEKVPGVPTYVATYDRTTRQLSKPVCVGYGPPPNDVHNSPSITMDSKGYLHVLCGTHGRPFPYAHSLAPNQTTAGWTEAKVLGEGLSQTYIGMVCGQDDSLYIAYRLWQRQKPPHPLATHATLAFQRKPADGPWQEPQILVVPPFSEYSVYRHRLTIDRRGRVFLSYDYWSTHWFYRNDHLGTRRAVLFSPDRGTSWKLLELEDLLHPQL